jgi:hypothetical protein
LVVVAVDGGTSSKVGGAVVGGTGQQVEWVGSWEAASRRRILIAAH